MTPSDESPVAQASPATAGLQERILPSGRTLVVKTDGRTEEIEIRSSGGEIEIRIALTKQGPVLSLSGARLEINATDTVVVNCKQFAVRATEGVLLDAAGNVEVRSGNEIKLRSAADTSIDGKLVKLNCLDRTEYPDDPNAVDVPELPAIREPSSNGELH